MRDKYIRVMENGPLYPNFAHEDEHLVASALIEAKLALGEITGSANGPVATWKGMSPHGLLMLSELKKEVWRESWRSKALVIAGFLAATFFTALSGTASGLFVNPICTAVASYVNK